MDGLSDGDAFTARELAARGFGVPRIAELLDVAEADVRAAVGQGSAEPPVEVDPLPSPVEPAPVVADPRSWPPPVDGSTQWTTVSPRRGYAGAATPIRVRWVMLWGQRVRINDSSEVWCHHCLQFRTARQLGHPFNSCPVGLPYRGGIVAVDFDEPEPVGDSPWTPTYIDFMRTPM